MVEFKVLPDTRIEALETVQKKPIWIRKHRRGLHQYQLEPEQRLGEIRTFFGQTFPLSPPTVHIIRTTRTTQLSVPSSSPLTSPPLYSPSLQTTAFSAASWNVSVRRVRSQGEGNPFRQRGERAFFFFEGMEGEGVGCCCCCCYWWP